MKRAMEAVKREISVSGAARQFQVSRKTLDDRVKGRVQHGAKPGLGTALTVEEEGALASYLLYMAERGFPLTINMARAFAWAVYLRTGIQARFNNETGPGNNWWRGFRSRHPELSLHTADNLERSRACTLTREVVDKYFDCLKTTLENNGLTNAPRQLFNCDKTFLPLNIPCSIVIARKNARHVYAQSRSRYLRTHHTSVLCLSSWYCSPSYYHIF